MYGEEEVNWGQKCPPRSNITHMCQNEKQKDLFTDKRLKAKRNKYKLINMMSNPNDT